MERWFKSQTPSNFDGLTARFAVSIPAAIPVFHSQTVTVCQAEVAIGFVRADGSFNGPAQFTALYSVLITGEKTRISLDRLSMLRGAEQLVELSYTESNAEHYRQ